MNSQTKQTEEQLQRTRIDNARRNGEAEYGAIELNEQQIEEDRTEIFFEDDESEESYFRTLNKLWTDKTPYWHAEMFSSPLQNLEMRQVTEGPVSKEELSKFPANGSIENINGMRIEKTSSESIKEFVEDAQEDFKPEQVIKQTFDRKMTVEDVDRSYEQDSKTFDLTEYPVKVDFKLLFGWIGKTLGMGLARAFKFGEEAATATVKQVKNELIYKTPTKEEQEIAKKKKEEEAKKNANKKSFFNNLMSFAKGFNPIADKALDARRDYVNKKVGLNEGFKGSFDMNGQLRTDLGILLEKKESEEAQKQEKAIERVEAQEVQGPRINIDAAVEGGTGKGGVANISSQAAG